MNMQPQAKISRRSFRFRVAGCLLAAVLGMTWPTLAGDWPMYKHDASRNGITTEKLAFPLRPAWVYTCAQPPRVAWPEPVKVLNRLDFDYAPQPVIANGIVCFGSSADDTIRALDLKTGAIKWEFITGGPIRFAPQIADGKVYAASDDGFAYCLDAVAGKLIWKFRAAPEDERLIGNERMISRWPCRTGVLVADGVAYTTAGMWSSEGVYVYALDAATGKVLWCNDTSGIVNEVRTLHVASATDSTSTDFGTFGVCPQGMLAASSDILVVPTGKGLPAGYNRKTGKLIYYTLDPVNNTTGGSAITIDGGRVFYNSANAGALFALDVATGKHDVKKDRFSDRELAKLHHWAVGRAYTLYKKGKISAIFLQGKPCFRNAYALALADDTLISGEENAVVAVKPGTKEEIWRAPVKGDARGLAIADGRLIVATHQGEISCFETGTEEMRDTSRGTQDGKDETGGGRLEIGNREQETESRIRNPKSEIISQLQAAGADRGYALVLGDADGQMSLALANQTQLHIISVLPESTAAELRKKLLAATALYGSRIEVQAVEKWDRLPFTQYFANAIVVAGAVPGLSGKELYRMLRPCGGLLIFPGLKQAEADALVKESGALTAERQMNGDRASILRGSLPGARDWDTGAMTDQRVKWPLQLLWFGGPGPSMVMDRKQGNVIGPVANGRYFVFGEDRLTAVDAYNGCLLWSRQVPRFFILLRYADDKTAIAGMPQVSGKPFVRTLSAEAEHVDLTLGCYFRGDPTEKSCIQINARTGEQQKIYGPYLPPTNVALKTIQTWPLEIDAAHSGSVTLQTTTEGLTLKLTTKDPIVTQLDRWDVFFDFRPFDQRYGLYERGAFQAQIFPPKDAKAPASWVPGTGPVHPTLAVSGTRETDGTTTTVQWSWAEIKKLTGGRQPSSFGFAVTLNSHDGKDKEDVVQKYLFSDIMADGLNNGWANVQLDGAEGVAAKTPAVIAGAFAAKPKPPAAKPPPVVPVSARLTPRIHPLTGEQEAKFYQTGSFGCGGISYSAHCAIARSTALSIYDFADDSGTRHFDGTKPSCTGSVTAALGLILSSEGRGGCECTTSFQTSLALAPADKRSNEDWAFYFDRAVDTRVRQAAINFGAPGDRRDSNGTLWLGFPRVGGNQTLGFSLLSDGAPLTGTGVFTQRVPPLRIPIEVEMFEGSGTCRVNADRTPIEGAQRPWIYTSGYRGIKKATLKLNFEKQLVSKLVEGALTVDGSLSEPSWSGEPQAVLAATKTDVFFRHDGENLYIASRRAPPIDLKGKVTPWPKTVLTEKQEFFRDPAWELFVSDSTSKRVIHLGLSSGGSRFDAFHDPAKGKTEDLAWTADWKGAVVADDKAFVTEIAIPWKILAAAGVDKNHVQLNFQMNTGLRLGEALCYLGTEGRGACRNFIALELGTPPPIAKPRPFTVRLHFAELDDVKPGQRVFDVKLQDQIVLKGFDVVKEAGGARTALIKEFQHIQASDTLTLEFIPSARPLDANSAPILSGIEVFDEDFKTAAKSPDGR